MKTRRRFLTSALLAAAALPAAPLLGAASGSAGSAAGAAFGSGGSVVPGFVIVNGWVLTEADLRMIEGHAG